MERGKVRFLSSVFAGYGFFFGRFPKLLRVAWFPGVLFVVAAMLANEALRNLDITKMSNAEASEALIYMLEVMLAYSLFQLAMTLIVVVGFYRMALHDWQPKGLLYFRFMGDELRTAGAWFLVVVTLYTIFMALVYVLIFAVAGYLGAVETGPAASGIVQLMEQQSSSLLRGWGILTFLVMSWAYARFFLAMPAALEHKASTLGEIWSATRGNSIRLLCYVLVLILSLTVFVLGLTAFITFAQMVASAILLVILPPETVEAVSERAGNLEETMASLPLWGRYTLAGLSQIGLFFAYIFFWAIVIGSAASAFRDIWPAQPGE